MDTFTLPATTYKPSRPISQPDSPTYSTIPLDRRTTINTIIEDEPQSGITRQSVSGLSYYFGNRSVRSMIMSPTYDEDFPTPKASELNGPAPPSPARSQPEADFDDLYDVTDSEFEEVPLKASDSVRRTALKRSSRYPSVVIPSPSAWPTIEKLQKSATAMPPTPAQPLTPSADALSKLASRNLQVPASSATPSLDGSLTSEELDKISCPSTPDVQVQKAEDGEWMPPIQLPLAALETLHHIAPDDEEAESVNQWIEVPEPEMRQVSASERRPRPSLNVLVSPSDNGSDPLSALSIPSPTLFFSSLNSAARKTWCPTEEPATSTAEEFYSVPWQIEEHHGADDIVERVVEVPEVHPEDRAIFSPFSGEVDEIEPTENKYGYDENYEKQLKQVASANLDRTSLWLSAQETYLSALCETTPELQVEDVASPVADITSPVSGILETSSFRSIHSSPSKKSVRFTEVFKTLTAISPIVEEDEEEDEEDEDLKDTTFLDGFSYLLDHHRKRDAFIHRATRAEAIHVGRRCRVGTHREQLMGKYEISSPVRPKPQRPISHIVTAEESEDEVKEMLAKVQREQQALDLIQPASWVLDATKALNGGKLLTQDASNFLSHRRDGSARALDLGGRPNCDWAWEVALSYPHATVYTAETPDQAALTRAVEGPGNHRVQTVPNLWTLPFPSNHFDIISARSLYALLKTDKPHGRRADEYDLCLQECLRCLKPGGYLEFNILDSDILHAGHQAAALSVEFGFNLKTRGYDPCPSKSFIPRLNNTGFSDIKRAWMVLPMAPTAMKWVENNACERVIGPNGEVCMRETGSVKDAAALTGLVGSWAWERWLVKLRMEMGWEEDRLLEGVVPVMEEGAREGSCWRYLSGWARKPF